eukprot:gnl/TRDRNA2_/TRDRNA2_130894_c0_seq1.p1 gnl/TRDRNA2_/TRDRNA2_130894_c0~~gnl/TRDRNA2_/TRDRNA2_130894_c0_seq1.p1  ORF type:complete len:312 (+),score=56.23 gnl/TRDRNA2_/TRDRNA2_130894_c0_seq1:48-983(+)
MPSARKAKPPTSKEAPKNESSDEQILKERQIVAAFERADLFHKFAGWGLGAFGVVWFLSVSGEASTRWSDPTISLMVLGFLSSQLARASPRGTWSAWRKLWHIMWCPFFAVMAMGFFSLSLRKGGTGAFTPSSCRMGMFATGSLAVVAVMLLPAGPSKPSPGDSSLVGGRVARMLLLVDAGLCFQGAFVAAFGSWKEAGGSLGIAVSVLPLISMGVALVFIRTEAEILLAVPTASFYLVMVIVRALLSPLNLIFVTISAVLLLVIHMGLYLPFPPQDPSSNPFHNSFLRQQRAFQKMMTQPVAGFGDEGGD